MTGWAEFTAGLSLTSSVTLAVLAMFTRPEQFELTLFMAIAVGWVLLWWATYRRIGPRRPPRAVRGLIDDQVREHARALSEVMLVLRVDAEANVELAGRVYRSFELLDTLVKGITR